MPGSTTSTSQGHTEAGGGFDLLKRATHSMMARTPGVDDDAPPDHIGTDTPRSGVATPQPDPHDRRLPGIMSYFGQVRPASLQRLWSATAPSPPCPSTTQAAASTPCSTRDNASQGLEACVSVARVGQPESFDHEQSTVCGNGGTPPKRSGRADEPSEQAHPLRHSADPYPTPPLSRCPSRHDESDRESASRETKRRAVSSSAAPLHRHKKSLSGWALAQSRRASLLTTITSPVVTESNVHAHISNPAFSTDASLPVSGDHESAAATDPSLIASSESNSGKLTQVEHLKSGHSTPTRSLSTVQAPPSEHNDESRRPSNESSGTAAPPSSALPAGTQAPAAKGRLTVKIGEARGLKRSRAPYVVAVFQRSELISGGPRTSDDDEAAIAKVAMGGVPISRQQSENGRIPMAIPMRSRQSSNTSNADHTSFRNRNARRSFTNPKWDAEAIFDVVDSDMLVDISVYDHGLSGEEFLGHVDFEAKRSSSHEPVRGWFPLRGNADTNPDNAPQGELFVEAVYQRTDHRHFGPSDFTILRLIGKGTFGQVYQVRKKDTKRIYAMKVLSKKVIVQKKEVAHTVGERNILVRTATTDSPFIVGLKFSFQTPTDLYLVTDYMSGGELFRHLQMEGRFAEDRAKFYIAELILAIQHLHQNDIVYRDLKPENILLDANGHIALCDFGLSKANLSKNATTNTFCGTTEYLAPEVLLDDQGYTKMVDFWSLGVLVFEMVCGWSPFYAEDIQSMYKNIAFGKVRFPRETLSVEGRSFVKGLLNRNAKHRLGAIDDAEELKRHAFFHDVDWDALSKKLITPPFRPILKSDTDVSYFDPEFTNALNVHGSLNERAAALSRGALTSTPLSPSIQAKFDGFTFVDESALEEQMKDQHSARDDDMGVDSHREDDDWDNVDDFEMNRFNRMSGIVGSNSHDEHMLL